MLNYVALGFLIFVAIFLFYAIIVIHDIPYEIAKKRKHPHQDAIHAAGWVSLFTLHLIWPFLWIWATLYREDRGWGMGPSGVTPPGEEPDGSTLQTELRQEIAALKEQLAQTEARLASQGNSPAAD